MLSTQRIPSANAGSTRWQAGGASVRGAGHVKDGSPNQDALAIWRPVDDPSGASTAIAAVADGHGSPACFRSEHGSRMAVESAVVVLRKMLLQSTSPEPIESRAPALRQWICSLWKLGVERHIAANPFTDQELDHAAAEADIESMRQLNGNPLVAYGCTLLCACATSSHVVYYQLGDGDVIAVNDAGQAHKPVTPGDGTFGDATHSLCTPESWRQMACRVEPAAAAVVILSTDGYSNSYGDDEAFLQVGADLGRRVRQTGVFAVQAQLPRWLDKISSSGSGDDITVALLARDSEPTQAA